MTATFLNELFAEMVRALPRLFLLGAPFLAIGIMLAAIADTRLPDKAASASAT
jgi:hypothetical protein